jgi:hypothetical protein
VNVNYKSERSGKDRALLKFARKRFSALIKTSDTALRKIKSLRYFSSTFRSSGFKIGIRKSRDAIAYVIYKVS